MNGPPQKPTTARSGASSAAHDPDRREERRERLLRVGHPQPLDVRQRPHGLLDHRPDALDEVDVEAHPDDRRHDVREHHGRVHLVPADGLQRHLGAELGRVRDLPERVPLAERAVLRQRAARLPHEPHGRALHVLTAGGTNQERLHGGLD